MSSGSSLVESAVEPTRSTNTTVSCRRSAPARVGCADGRATGCGSAVTPRARFSPCKAAIAARSLRRWPIEVTPRPTRSSAVSSGRMSAPISLSRNACSYCESCKLRSQVPMSTSILHQSPGARSQQARALRPARTANGQRHGSEGGTPAGRSRPGINGNLTLVGRSGSCGTGWSDHSGALPPPIGDSLHHRPSPPGRSHRRA